MQKPRSAALEAAALMEQPFYGEHAELAARLRAEDRQRVRMERLISDYRDGKLMCHMKLLDEAESIARRRAKRG